MKHKIALFVPSLRGGGAERVMVNLARGFAEEGHPVDLVLAKAEGPYLKDVPESVRIVDLASPRVLQSLPGLVKYLRRERPHALLSALDHANVVALWAKQLAGVATLVSVSIHSTTSHGVLQPKNLRGRFLPWLITRFYHSAYKVVAVSDGVANDFSQVTGVSRNAIEVIYNPVVTPEVLSKSVLPLQHPWFAEDQPPIIIGVGRLALEKDFSTLIKAFAKLRERVAVRLIILGDGEEKHHLKQLIASLGLKDDVYMPGFVDNPYPYMKASDLFVLSSMSEGLPTVLIEALALGCRVVSTDCKNGPREILEGGMLGALVPTGDVEQLYKAMFESLTSLQKDHPDKLEKYKLKFAANRYIREMV